MQAKLLRLTMNLLLLIEHRLEQQEAIHNAPEQ